MGKSGEADVAAPILNAECLSPDLVAAAQARGHHATHVVHRGLQGIADRRLIKTIFSETFILVTNNGKDFLRLYASEQMHPGLVIIVPNGIGSRRQIELFEIAMAMVEARSDLVNMVVEVFANGRAESYPWPTPAGELPAISP